MLMNTSRKTYADVAQEIWLEIFRYATYVPQAMDFTPVDAFIPTQPSSNALGPNTEVLTMRTKCVLVLVCRAWRQVTIQLLYEYIPIKSPRRADLILQSLQGRRRISATEEIISESYGKWARHIKVETFAKGSESIQYLQKVFRICQHCPNVRVLSGIWRLALPQSFHDAVSRLYARSLQGLLWEEMGYSSLKTPSFATPSFFETFRSLRVLRLSLHRAKLMQPLESCPVLPQVSHLILLTDEYTLSVAATFRLPVLNRVTFAAHQDNDQKQTAPIHHFLHVHGSNISYLDLGDSIRGRDISLFLQPGGCPNLQDLVYDIVAGPMNPLGHPHKSLRRIGLRGLEHRMILYTVKGHFRTFNHDAFPALELVRTVGFLVAQALPTYGRYDTLNAFIRWVEEFEQDGIDLQDGEGVVWLRSEDGCTFGSPRFARW